MPFGRGNVEFGSRFEAERSGAEMLAILAIVLLHSPHLETLQCAGKKSSFKDQFDTLRQKQIPLNTVSDHVQERVC